MQGDLEVGIELEKHSKLLTLLTRVNIIKYNSVTITLKGISARKKDFFVTYSLPLINCERPRNEKSYVSRS